MIDSVESRFQLIVHHLGADEEDAHAYFLPVQPNPYINLEISYQMTFTASFESLIYPLDSATEIYIDTSRTVNKYLPLMRLLSKLICNDIVQTIMFPYVVPSSELRWVKQVSRHLDVTYGCLLAYLPDCLIDMIVQGIDLSSEIVQLTWEDIDISIEIV